MIIKAGWMAVVGAHGGVNGFNERRISGSTWLALVVFHCESGSSIDE